MFNQLKYRIRDFFSLNKGEQRAIIILTVLVLGVIAINISLPYLLDHQKTDHQKFINEIALFRSGQQQYADSIKIENLQNRGELDLVLAQQKLKPFTFDPNTMNKEDWQKLGLSNKQIQNIENYIAKGGKFKTKEDFKKLYNISDIEYSILEPYLNLPVRNENKKTKTFPDKKKKSEPKAKIRETIQTIELNAADSAILASNLKLPAWLVSNIITYRDMLGGFYEIDQLAEVYGFDTNRFKTKKKYVTIDTAIIKKINLNKCSFKELNRHPYVSFETTRDIMNLRLEKGQFNSLDFLLDEQLVSEELFLKIKIYLTVD